MIRARTTVRNRAARRQGLCLAADIGALLRNLLQALFDPYRPELHYMRGPGPRWRAKYDCYRPAGAPALPTPLPPRAPNPVAVPVLIRGS
jgi:hypothetical protein